MTTRTHDTGKGATDQAFLRQHNLTSVMSFVRDHQPVARSEIALRTGLARGSVTGLTGMLIEAGLLEESTPMTPRGPGRPLAPLALGGSTAAVIAVQIHAEHVELYAADLAERPLSSARIPHGSPLRHAEIVAQAVATLVIEAVDSLEADGVATSRLVIVVPGPVLKTPHVVATAIDMGWPSVDIIALLRERLPDYPFQIDLVNDADMAALAEYRAMGGAGSGVTHLAYLKSDTGIGGGLIADGRLFLGSHGIGFEPGHVIVIPEGPLCMCGRRGCLATVAGPEAVIEEVGLGELRSEAGLMAAVARLVTGALDGEPRYVEALQTVGHWLNDVIRTIGILFDTQRVVLGGYWAEVFDLLHLDQMRSGPLTLYASEGFDDAVAAALAPPVIAPGMVGPRAALIGAVSYAVDDLLLDPLAIRRADRRPAESRN